MTWSLSKKTIILPSTLMKCLWNVNVRNEKTAPSPGEADSFSCWFFVGAVKRVKLWNTSSLLKTKTSRCFACKAPRPKSLIHKSQGAMILQKKKLRFSGHLCYLHPETLGKWSNFWGAYFSKGNLKSPTSFVQVFLRSNTRGKKSSLLKSIFKGDQVMAVQQQRQGPNGCGVLVAKKLVLGVM